MKTLLRKMVLYGVPAMLLCIFTFLALQYAPAKRLMVVLLLVATTFLVISSVAGFFFIKVFVLVGATAGENYKRRIIGFVLAAISFGISFGSGKLLGHLLSRV